MSDGALRLIVEDQPVNAKLAERLLAKYSKDPIK